MNNKRIQRMLREVKAFRMSGAVLFTLGLLAIALALSLTK